MQEAAGIGSRIQEFTAQMPILVPLNLARAMSATPQEAGPQGTQAIAKDACLYGLQQVLFYETRQEVPRRWL